MINRFSGNHIGPRQFEFPPNIPLRDVLDLTHNTSDGEHDLLNPNGVNVIRSFLGEGIRIFGARTLTSFHDGRHYVNVRRLLNFIKDSLKTGLRFAIFELNEQRTWDTIRNVVNEFLQSLFLRGALFSPDGTPERAFFVERAPDASRRFADIVEHDKPLSCGRSKQRVQVQDCTLALEVQAETQNSGMPATNSRVPSRGSTIQTRFFSRRDKSSALSSDSQPSPSRSKPSKMCSVPT